MLEIKDISISYGKCDVLQGISFTLVAGRVVVLLGANGAGKTTLIKAVNGTLPLSSGKILIDGAELVSISRREIARSIAVVAQENETRFPVTVLEFVLSGRFVHGNALGWDSDADIEFARSSLAGCDLSRFETRLMNHLSGGERQRVVLARALATGSKILLLDEPTANLDLAHQAMMFRLVRERCLQSNYSAIVITHDLNLAAEFADEIIMLNRGRIDASGTPEEVLTTDNVEEVFGVKVLLDENPASRKLRVTAIY